ncbi:MAG: 3-oxoacyl-[acyl-carrier-protein] reductase [Pseudomonadota bacterium]|nr:3-oxoacyl-[acyl-carrier-protein] reductase [Pseudomonadota bacterium]|tara:strand:- start:7 stop:744 length:738 start_codon:yes stop_codon:yes gene_type:complete
MLRLKEKKVLITGATGGIGSAMAKRMAKQGADLVLSGTKKDSLETLSSEIGDNCYSFAADLAKKEEIKNLVIWAIEKMGGIDILVNNAGITRDNLSIRMSDEDWDDVINVNLTASFLLSRDCLKVMLKKRWGRIINITSVVGVMGNAGQSNYAASKAGMIGMTKSIASEVASRGITVNCISPGYVVTAMTDKISDAAKENILQNTPVGRFGKAEEIADWAIYLASNEADYITGQNININGGLVMV